MGKFFLLPFGAVLRVGIEAVEEVVRQKINVAGSLPQRGEMDNAYRKAVKEILSKASGRHVCQQIPMSRCQDAYIHLDWSGFTYRRYFLLLNCPQEFGLGIQRQVAHLVQEQGAALSLAKVPLPVAVRAGECAFPVAKQLGVHQLPGNGAAIDGEK